MRKTNECYLSAQKFGFSTRCKFIQVAARQQPYKQDPYMRFCGPTAIRKLKF